MARAGAVPFRPDVVLGATDMWIEVDSNKQGIKSWVASEHIERCDVNETPVPPFAALTLRSGMICYISDPWSMKKLQRVMGVDLPRAAD